MQALVLILRLGGASHEAVEASYAPGSAVYQNSVLQLHSRNKAKRIQILCCALGMRAVLIGLVYLPRMFAH